MNIDSNRLASADAFASMAEAFKAGYIPVPNHLSKRAEKLLHGRKSARVPRSGNHPLTKWAADKRRKRRAMTRQSRRANR